jgi:ribosome-associated toxin RatA of RatAB toxin-antitoxin module
MRRIILLLLLSLLSAPSTAAPLPLSAGDLARLYEGEIVFRGELPSLADAPSGNGGTALALLHANSEEVWLVLTDFDHYAGLFPRLAESATVTHSGDRALVRFRVAVGPFSFRFFVNHVVSQEERQIRWRLDRSQANGLFRDTWGYWRLDPASSGSGSVLVTYAMGSRTVLPAFLTRGSERKSVVQTLAALKARVERPAEARK